MPRNAFHAHFTSDAAAARRRTRTSSARGRAAPSPRGGQRPADGSRDATPPAEGEPIPQADGHP